MLGALLVVVLGARTARPVPTAVDVALYGIIVLLTLYVAHLRDSLVDTYERPQLPDAPQGGWWDHGGRLSERQLRVALSVTILALWGTVALLVIERHITPLIVVPVGYATALGLAYSPWLDTHPGSITLSYPSGVVAAYLGAVLLGGGILPEQAGTALALCLLFGCHLSGGKALSDLLDLEEDALLGKRTLGRVLGKSATERVGLGLLVTPHLLIALAVLASWLPMGWLPLLVLGAALALVTTLQVQAGRLLEGIFVSVLGAYLMVGLLLWWWPGGIS